MPRFDFRCRKCLQIFEAEIPFGSKDFPVCTHCGGETDKLISPPAIHFKGGGFYKTDSRKTPPPAKKEEKKQSSEEKPKKADSQAKDKDSTKSDK